MAIRCNNCMKTFKDEDELELFDDGEGYFFVGCPECKTDEYLMDMVDDKLNSEE